MSIFFRELVLGVECLSSVDLGVSSNPMVTQVTSDSREIIEGSVYVAVKGNQLDGHRFVEEVALKKPLLIIGEEKRPSLPLLVPYIQVADSRECLSELVTKFYGSPSLKMKMIGITGTSGKTTTSYLVESILKAAGHKVGVIGTINCRFGNTIVPSNLTSPGPAELQRLLAQMLEAGCTAVVMEVSSHALKQKRVSTLAFDGMIFTNLTQDHLDYHESMENYFYSKFLLFSDLAKNSLKRGKKPVAIVNQEDPYGARLLIELRCLKSEDYLVKGVSLPDELTLDESGITLATRNFVLHSLLSGRFNALNILEASELALELGIEKKAIEQGIASLTGVPGRLEKVQHSGDFFVWVDYAHKPDALENVIRTLRGLCDSKKLITVFGCGGDRDRTKRPEMGRIAAEGSDFAIVTSDNPRSEDPMLIIDEILEGMKSFQNFEVEVDREKAIFRAIELAQTGDFVLIAGKGHEKYQMIGVQKRVFDDVEVARRAVYSKRKQFLLTQPF